MIITERRVPFVLLLLLSACTGGTEELDLSCESNLDCKTPGTRCDTEIKLCVCANDEACEDGYFCNRAGVCQEQAGCLSNLDCQQQDTFCDLTSGQCLSGPVQQLESLCGIASHCPYGTICSDGRCEIGCFDDGDCPLGQICWGDECITGDGICSDHAFCGYGELCKNRLCTKDRRGPYCRGCEQRTITNPEPCDQPRNFCLVNSQETGGFDEICGVDCSLGQECANGYACYDVVILTEQVCFSHAECQCKGQLSMSTNTCTVAEACVPRLPNGDPDPNGVRCSYPGQEDCNGGQEGGDGVCFVAKDQHSGVCSCVDEGDCAGEAVCISGWCCTGTIREERQCAVGESQVSGFCTCATDDDCPQDVCDGSRGACAITGMPCTPGSDDCGAIPCVDAGCRIGNNCAPLQGLSCSEVAAE